MFGFVGPNGAGKTTVIRIILGVLAADDGEVRWRGRPMDEETAGYTGHLPEDQGNTFPQQYVSPVVMKKGRSASVGGTPQPATAATRRPLGSTWIACGRGSAPSWTLPRRADQLERCRSSAGWRTAEYWAGPVACSVLSSPPSSRAR